MQHQPSAGPLTGQNSGEALAKLSRSSLLSASVADPTHSDIASEPAAGAQTAPTEEWASHWCAGLPRREMVQLSQAEQRGVQTAMRRRRLSGFVFAAFAVSCLGGAVATWIGGASQPEVIVFMLGFASPVLALAAHRTLRVAALLGRDATRGEAEHFADQVDNDASSLWRRELRVLPHSRLPLRRDGRPLAVRYRVQTKSVAPAPRSCFTVDIPEHIGVRDPEGRPIKRRHLSAQERLEIQAQVKEIQAIPVWFVGFLLYLAAGSAGATLLSGSIGWTIYFWLQFSVFAHLLVLTLRRFLARYLSANKLKNDISLGWVFCIMGGAHDDQANQAGRYEEVIEEVLGHARRPWSRLGQPAPWRTRALS